MIFIIFIKQVPWLCWLESLYYRTQCFSTIFFELFYQLLRIVEEQNRIGLFDTGFSFKNIHDSQQGKGQTISLTPLYHFHPPSKHIDISRVINEDS